MLQRSPPNEIVNYAEENSASLLETYLAYDNNENINDNLYTLGSPINVQEYNGENRIYNFPLMKNGKIFAMLSIYDDNGKYTSHIEENMMAHQLRSMQDAGTLNDIKFYSDENGFYAINENESEAIPLTPDSKTANLSNSLIENAIDEQYHLIESDICSPITTINMNSKETEIDNNIESQATTAKTLNVKSIPQTDDGTFTGTQKEWCGAAVTAAIINYKKGTSLSAKSVTIEALGSAKNAGMTNKQVIAVANNHGLSPNSGNPLSYSSVKSQINANQPIYMQMQRTKSDGSKGYHALGLIGYSSTKFTLINPWYEKSFTVDKKDTGSDVTYITGDRTYKWYTSVYNWK